MLLALTKHQKALLASSLQCAETVKIHSIPAITMRRFQEKRHILPQNNEPRKTQLKNALVINPVQPIADRLMDLLTKRFGPRLKNANAATKMSNNFNGMSSAFLNDLPTIDQLIRAIAKTQSTEKDLRSIEYQLIKQRYKMPLPVALNACYAFYKVQHAMPFYLPALFSVVEETFESMQPSPEEITFLFLYVFLHGRAPEMLFHLVEKYLLKHFHHFHINDLGVISAGFFRANRRIMSQDLLEVMAHKLLTDFSFVDPQLLMTFMKVFRHASYVRISFYNKLADSLLEDNYLSHSNSTNSLMHLAFTYASIPMVHKELFEQLLCRFEALLDQKTKTRTKDLSKFVWACGTLQFKPHDYQQRFRKLAKHFELSSVEQFPESLAELLVGLIYLEIFPEDLLSRCLSPDVANRLADSAADKEKSFQLLILNETMKIECPFYSGPTLLQSQRQALLVHPAVSRDIEFELQTRTGLASVLESLQISLGTERVQCHFPLPHFKTAVIELEYCMTDGFVQVDPKQPLHQSSFKQTSVIPRIIIDDLYTTTKDKSESVHHKEKRTKIAIAMANANQQAINRSQPLGHWGTKIRQLQKLGYKVCQISAEDATKLEVSSHKERCHLLSQHLSMCLATAVNLPHTAVKD